MTRNVNTRESETRKHEIRPIYDMSYRNPLVPPPGVKKEGYTLGWISKDIKGESNFRVEEKSAMGWTPVPVDRVSGLIFDPLNRNPLSQKFICVKDLILMECPDELANRERAHNIYLANSQLKNLRGVTNDIGGFAKPLPSIDSF